MPKHKTALHLKVQNLIRSKQIKGILCLLNSQIKKEDDAPSSKWLTIESFLLVVSRGIQLKCLICTEIIKSPVWTTTLIPVAGRDTFCVKCVEVNLFHVSTTFYGALTPKTLLSYTYYTILFEKVKI